MIFFLRHGERADQANKDEIEKIQLDYDPHLTQLGQVQSFLAGKQIKEIIQQQKMEDHKLVFISSPFLRCIMTSENLAYGLGYEKIKEEGIYVENNFCEMLRPQWYKQCPLNSLILRDQESIKKYVNVKLNENFIANELLSLKPVYPEIKFNDIYERYNEIFGVLENYLKQEQYQKTIFIISTHGFAIQSILEKNNLVQITNQVEYTSINAFKYNLHDTNNYQEKIITYSHSHIQQAQELNQKYIQSQKL